MTYYGGKDLADAFRTVRKNTITIAEDIPEEHYGFRATPDTRTVAQTLVHIALIPELSEHIHGNRITDLEGFDFFGFIGPRIAQEQVARAKEQILSLLRESGDRIANWLESLPEEFLAEVVSMPRRMPTNSKTRFEMLLGIKEHEMHHRGQLMLMERMLGIVPHLTREFQARIAAMQSAKATT